MQGTEAASSRLQDACYASLLPAIRRQYSMRIKLLERKASHKRKATAMPKIPSTISRASKVRTRESVLRSVTRLPASRHVASTEASLSPRWPRPNSAVVPIEQLSFERIRRHPPSPRWRSCCIFGLSTQLQCRKQTSARKAQFAHSVSSRCLLSPCVASEWRHNCVSLGVITGAASEGFVLFVWKNPNRSSVLLTGCWSHLHNCVDVTEVYSRRHGKDENLRALLWHRRSAFAENFSASMFVFLLPPPLAGTH